MEQLNFIPFKCKIKLNREEYATLCRALGRYEYRRDPQSRARRDEHAIRQELESAACAEWIMKKRMEMVRRLMDPRREYSLTFAGIDALMLYSVCTQLIPADEYEWAMLFKIKSKIDVKI